MNVNIKNLEELLIKIQNFKNQVESNNQELIKRLDNYIDDDRYQSKAFKKSKEKVDKVVKPILKQYVKVLDVLCNDLERCINYYHNEVDVINLDIGYIDELISKVKNERQKVEHKLQLSRTFKTDLAHSFGIQYKLDHSYSSLCELENLLGRKREELNNFMCSNFFSKSQDEIAKLRSMVSRADVSNIMERKIAEAVGVYAVLMGKARKITINGITYYEFIEDITFYNYGENPPRKLYITVVDGEAMAYLKALDGSKLSIPNGFLAVINNDPPITPIDNNGKYRDLFSMILSDTFDASKMTATVITQNTPYFDKISEDDQKKIKKYTNKICDKYVASDLAIAMTTKLASEQGYEDISLDVLNEVASPFVQDIISEEDRVAYMGGEIEAHAEGVRGKSIDAWAGRTKYEGDNKLNQYYEAMQTGDLDLGDVGDKGKFGTLSWVVKNLYMPKHKAIIQANKWGI